MSRPPSDPSPAPGRPDRRAFLRLGGLLTASGLLAGCRAAHGDELAGSDQVRGRVATDLESAEVWRRGAGAPYERGALPAPGVCSLLGPNRKIRFPDPDKYRGTTQVPGMCQLCSTVCGIIGYVKDGRILKVDGNPRDPNSRGRLCARGQAALNHQYHPERLLHPLRRVGARGQGRWRRISWEQAYAELAERLSACRAEDPGQFAFHQGRNRSPNIVSAFLNAFGTNTHLNHRGLCSAARRAANQTWLFESDWDLGDYEHSRYILNFGSNMFEAHQGHVAGAQRIQRGRFENGAKLVTFDVRMSNTAGNSDEFFMPAPGTDGAVALAMAHVIISEGLVDRTFFDAWANRPLDDLWQQLKDYTPAWASELSTVPADDIARIAREFAAAAPAATTMCNRGSSAHLNGYYNDRAIGLLNVLVGSVGKPGGWCWMWTGSTDSKRFPSPYNVPASNTPSVLADPPEFVLANAWNKMKVGEIVYWYLRQKRARIAVYMTYNLDSPLTWPEMDLTANVLLDEQKIGFHVAINPFFNETASFADMVLPWTTFLERWECDARGAYNLKPYLGVRWPMTEPLGEAKDLNEILPELARRIGGGMEAHFPPELDAREGMRRWTANVPFDQSRYADALDFLATEGSFEDPDERPYFEPYLQPLSAEQMDGAEIDAASGIITRDGKGIGILHEGRPVVGFKTPSRKLEVHSEFVQRTAANQDTSALTAIANSKGKNRPAHHKGHEYVLSPWPVYMGISDHENLDDDQLVMTSFKWNVHNHGRTANLKWLAEIVHSNPAWIHPDTATRFDLKSGDWIELSAKRFASVDKAMPGLELGSGELAARLQIPVLVTPGVHPRAIAISNSLGHWQYTAVARAERQSSTGSESKGMQQQALRDADWERNMWWQDDSRGDRSKWVRNSGAGWAQNHVLPIAPDFISGQQSFNDTVVRVRKLS